VTKKADDNGNGALSPEVAAVKTVDDFEDGFKRVQGTVSYIKKKLTWEGKLLEEWKREFDVKIPEGSTNVEIAPVLRTLAAKYHKACSHKHRAETAFLLAQSRYAYLLNKEVDDLTTSKEKVVKGRKQNFAMSVEKAKHKARIADEVAATKNQMVVAEITLKMWDEILGALRFTYGVAKSIQMGNMSENKLELANQLNTPASIKG
jgi:hypothetical protein